MHFRRVRINREKRLLASSCLFVCLFSCISAAPTGRILLKFDIRVLRKSIENVQIWLKWDKCIGHFTLHEDLSKFILLTVVRNTLYLDNSKKGTCCCISVATRTLSYC